MLSTSSRALPLHSRSGPSSRSRIKILRLRFPDISVKSVVRLFGRRRLTVLAMQLAWLMAAVSVSAQTLARPIDSGVIDGIVTTQSGTIRLPGAQVVVRDSNSQEVARVLTEGDGHFRVVGLPAGSYQL